ncbi:hypothetical protein ACFOQM_00530 [Paenibacillus sp. GCM10012307]|uniref:Uncharacterized protein n=1 Tax=Paenibacillus roseus TaxID=2798579 RepID=A0A934J3L2_9BACL|nr:hypothetical protein [Paenibacillus roseus]MBJ6359810.1 hypothetical protein [Paenibacillus roseus]
MFRKILACVTAAVLISLVATALNYNSELAKSYFYYSFIRQFTVGTLIILSIYIFYLVPISIFIDRFVSIKYRHKTSEIALISFLLYSIIPSSLCFILLILFFELKRNLFFTLIIAALSIFLWIIQILISIRVKKNK